MERLSIEEAINHAREVAKDNREKCTQGSCDRFSKCIECAEEHEQLAEWLTELKRYKDLEEQGLLLKLPCKVGSIIYGYVVCS